MKPLLLVLCCAIMFISSRAQQPVWSPAPGHTQMPIWPGPIPDAHPAQSPETVKLNTKDLVAGRPWLEVGNVARPTITIYPPRATNTGAAILVFPGGGYEILAIDLEGTEACDWLTAHGITCVLLKYRVPAPRSAPDWGAYPQSPMALEDAQRALSIVRHRAAELGINPKKIGVLGFSAGGHLAAAVSVHFAQRLYAPVDAADAESCRPDFAIAIYPGHMAFSDDGTVLNPDLHSHLSAQTPPTFLLQNGDDNVDSVNDALSFYRGLKQAGVPVEMHLYAHGGHAFGLRPTSLPATHWPSLVQSWLAGLGITTP